MYTSLKLSFTQQYVLEVHPYEYILTYLILLRYCNSGRSRAAIHAQPLWSCAVKSLHRCFCSSLPCLCNYTVGIPHCRD